MNTSYLVDFKYWLIILIEIVGFVVISLKLFAKSYSSEKGKNLATKEDIGEITQIVESLKASLTIKTEEIKSELSYKNEHLIHLRASERAAIINYYKATWVLVLGFTKADLIKHEIDNFDEEKDKHSSAKTLAYLADGELMLNKMKEELSNLKYLRDISESELMFFYDEPELAAIIGELNLSLAEFERALFRSVNLLLQIFSETSTKINNRVSLKDAIIDAKRTRSDVLANWYEDRYTSLTFIRKFTKSLKEILHNRLTSLTV